VLKNSLHLTLYASRFTHMNQTDQFNVKCGDQTPNFDFLISLIERQKSLIHPCLSPACWQTGQTGMFLKINA